MEKSYVTIPFGTLVKNTGLERFQPLLLWFWGFWVI
jgi:hypothetical protein